MGAFPLGKNTSKSGNSTSLPKPCPPARLRFSLFGVDFSLSKAQLVPCASVCLRQQICQPQTMASFCRQWAVRALSQEGRARGGTIGFQSPVAEWVLRGGSRRAASSKAPFIGPAASEKWMLWAAVGSGGRSLATAAGSPPTCFIGLQGLQQPQPLPADFV